MLFYVPQVRDVPVNAPSNENYNLTVYTMKRLGFRSAFVSTVEKVGLKNECSQTTEPQLFYIVC